MEWIFQIFNQLNFKIIVIAFSLFGFGYKLGSKITTRKLEKKKRNWQQRQLLNSRDSSQIFDINTVKKTEYFPRNVLNESEKRLYYKLINYLKENYNVHPQVSLGEILSCPQDVPHNLGYRAINSKRCDFTVSKRGSFSPVAVIEYQGAGHYQGNSKERDAIKKLATEKAGLIYIALAKDLVEDKNLRQLRDKIEPI